MNMKLNTVTHDGAAAAAAASSNKKISFTNISAFSTLIQSFSHHIGLVICNWAVLLSILITIWCTFDAAGRSWVKMKKYQRSMRESESRFNYKRSGSMNRNWRQRFVNLISCIFLYQSF